MRYQIEDVLFLPHRDEGLRDFELSEADGVIGRNVELQIIAGCKGNSFAAVFRLKNQFLDERCNTAVADDSKLEGLL